jgi:hypothetical protein
VMICFLIQTPSLKLAVLTSAMLWAWRFFLHPSCDVSGKPILINITCEHCALCFV